MLFIFPKLIVTAIPAAFLLDFTSRPIYFITTFYFTFILKKHFDTHVKVKYMDIHIFRSPETKRKKEQLVSKKEEKKLLHLLHRNTFFKINRINPY